MPSLYKSNYVYKNENQVRIINSDEIVSQKNKEEIQLLDIAQKVEKQGTNREIFVAEANSLLNQAKAEAEEIIRQAKSKSDKILKDAIEKSAILEKEAKEEGYLKGIEEGETAGKEKIETALQEIVERKSALEADYEKSKAELEYNLIDQLLKVFQVVFDVYLDDKREIVLYLLQRALGDVEETKQIRLRVNERTYLFIEERMQSIKDLVANDVEIVLVKDKTLDAGKCFIETDRGVYDCSFDVQMQSLWKDIRLLSS